MEYNQQITLFGRISWVSYGLKTITVDDAIQMIKNGTYYIDDQSRTGWSGTLKEITEYIQHLPDGNDLQGLKEQYLLSVSFNGVYDNGIIQYSSITALDFDHIPSQEAYTELYRRLVVTPCVRNIYRTPSGKGLKALVLHDNHDPSMHENLYRQLMDMFKTTDPKCKDLNRRNYLCYDTYVWTNPNPIAYHFEYDKNLEAATIKTDATTTVKSTTWYKTVMKSNDTPSDASVMGILKSRCRRYHPDYLCEGYRRDVVFWFGTQASRAGVDYDYGLEYVKSLYNGSEIKITRGGYFSEDEIVENFKNGYG